MAVTENPGSRNQIQMMSLINCLHYQSKKMHMYFRTHQGKAHTS